VNGETELTFGIYPGGAAGGDSGLLSGPADNPAQVRRCLDELQGDALPFVLRCYDSFQDRDSPFGPAFCAPANYEQYAQAGKRPLDLVLQYRSASANLDGFLAFVRGKIEKHHALLYSVQIAEEPNFADGPNVIDGPYLRVMEAVIQGVIEAKSVLRSPGRDRVKVGFNATPTFGPSAAFWSELKRAAASDFDAFLASLDYVGLDFFPDVFRRTAPDGQPGDLRSSIAGVIGAMRNEWLPAAGIPSTVPIHITEHGWPTGPARSLEHQADVLRHVMEWLYAERGRLNIERYTLFSLRDVDHETAANAENVFAFFGITKADYSRKPAFDVFKSLVREFGTSGTTK
jgi:hypothetical protein